METVKPENETENKDNIPANTSGISEVSPDTVFKAGKTAENTSSGFGQSDSQGKTENPGNDLKNDYGTGSGHKTKAGDLVSGTFAVGIMDKLIPAVVVIGGRQLGYDINSKDLSLTASEKETIAQPMQDFLDSVNINFDNPLYNLLFVVSVIYGSKIIDIAPDIRKTVSKKEKVKVNAEASAAKQEEQKNDIQEFNEALLGMSKQAAIIAIKKRRNKGQQDAERYYQKVKEGK